MRGRWTSGPGRPPHSTGRGRRWTGIRPSGAVGICRPDRPAIVLGSTQTPGVVDVAAARSAGLEVVRRRSGGGAVLVTPDDPAWVDVWVPGGDPLWSPDVTAAFGWLGTAWADALGRLGLGDVAVQGSGPGTCTRWSSLVCFGGVGAGEVTVGARKVVGLSQRRNRSGAWFHGACLLRWDPTLLLEVLDLSPGERPPRLRDWPPPLQAWSTLRVPTPGRPGKR